MSDLTKEEEWLEQLSEGSAAAYEQLFATYWPQIHTLVKMLVKSEVQAEDLAQEIFIKIWNRRTDLKNVHNLQAYLYTIARNASLDFLKKRVLVTENLDHMIVYLKDESLGPEQRMMYKDLETCLHEGINNLPDTVRKVFVMSRFEHLSHEEIAQQLDISIHSSKVYVVRALKALRLHMRNHAHVHYVVVGALILSTMGAEAITAL
jgi:RNA polymerase sigma-70 factor (family 1)